MRRLRQVQARQWRRVWAGSLGRLAAQRDHDEARQWAEKGARFWTNLRQASVRGDTGAGCRARDYRGGCRTPRGRAEGDEGRHARGERSGTDDGSGQPGHLRREALEQLALGPGGVVLGKAGDLLEELAAPRVVEPHRRDRFLRCQQAVAHVVASGEHVPPVTNVPPPEVVPHDDPVTAEITPPAEHFRRVPVVLPVALSVMSRMFPV